MADGPWHNMTAKAVAALSMYVDFISRSLKLIIAMLLSGGEKPPNRARP
jgi:hypothetical protein